MTDPTGLAVLAAALGVAALAAIALRLRDGRLRRARAGAAPTGGWSLAGAPPAAAERVLLLQLSSPVCAPCRRTAELLGALAGRTPGLVHREVDVSERPDAARALGVMRTPTVVAFDRGGAELLRVSGVPRVDDLLDALSPALRTG